MKIGAENKKELYAMLALAALAVFMIVWRLVPFTGSSTAPAPPPTNASTDPSGNANPNEHGRTKKEPPLDPTLRTDLLKNSEEAQYKGSGRNIFEAHAEIPQPSQTVINKNPEPHPQPQPPPGPPPPPPIPLKFYGFANRPGQPKSIFLANGDDIFIGHEGDIVNRRYKIVHIMPTQVEIEDVLNNHHEAIPLTQGSV